MYASKKSTSRATAVATSKGKSVAVVGTRAFNPPILSDVHVKEVNEELSLLAIMPKVGVNQLEATQLIEGQLLQIFSSLQEKIRRAKSGDDS